MRLTKLELAVMEALWKLGAVPIREIHEAFPADRRPAYTTVQTIVYRLEAKRAVRRVKRIGNANIFEALVSRGAAQRRLIDELLAALGGGTEPLFAHLIDSGKITAEDLAAARKRLRELTRKEESK